MVRTISRNLSYLSTYRAKNRRTRTFGDSRKRGGGEGRSRSVWRKEDKRRGTVESRRETEIKGRTVVEEWCRATRRAHATCCGSFTNERQRKAHAFIRADIKVPTVYALLGHNKVRMRVQRISRLLRTHTVFFTMRISLSLSPSFSPSLLVSLSLHLSLSLSLARFLVSSSFAFADPSPLSFHPSNSQSILRV